MKRIPPVATLVVIVVMSTGTVFSNVAQIELMEGARASSANILVPLTPRRIKLGMTHSEVLAGMHGKADRTVTPDIWIYWNFHGTKRPPGLIEPALIVFFKAGRVYDIRFSESELVRKTLVHYEAASMTSRPK
jgi:hypothetical protein